MSLDWIGPSTVGLAGVVLAWRTTRDRTKFDAALAQWQHDAQREAVIREERRSVYAAFLAAIERAEQLSSDVDDEASAVEALQACLEVNRLEASMLLVGPVRLHDAVLAAVAAVRDAGIAIGATQQAHPIPSGPRGRLLGEMMVILGYISVAEAEALPDPDEPPADQRRTTG